MNAGALPRHTVGLAAIVVAALAVLGWVALAGGDIHGTVTLSACGGAQIAGGGSNCSRRAVPQATVVAVRAQQANWIYTGGGRLVLQAPAPPIVAATQTDPRGAYRLSLPAGDYLVGAKVENWVEDEGNGIRTLPFTQGGMFTRIHVDRLSSQEFDPAIIFSAP